MTQQCKGCNTVIILVIIITLQTDHVAVEGCTEGPEFGIEASARTFSCPINKDICHQRLSFNVICASQKETVEYECLICLWEEGQLQCIIKPGYAYRLSHQTLTVGVNSTVEEGHDLQIRLHANGGIGDLCKSNPIQSSAMLLAIQRLLLKGKTEGFGADVDGPIRAVQCDLKKHRLHSINSIKVSCGASEGITRILLHCLWKHRPHNCSTTADIDYFLSKHALIMDVSGIPEGQKQLACNLQLINATQTVNNPCKYYANEKTGKPIKTTNKPKTTASALLAVKTAKTKEMLITSSKTIPYALPSDGDKDIYAGLMIVCFAVSCAQSLFICFLVAKRYRKKALTCLKILQTAGAVCLGILQGGNRRAGPARQDV